MEEKAAAPELENIVFKIDKDLKKKYQTKCIDQETTMKDELTGHIKKYVES